MAAAAASPVQLILREFVQGDWPALHAFDPEAVRYQSYDPRTAEGCRAMIRRCLADPVAQPRRVYDLAGVRRGTSSAAVA